MATSIPEKEGYQVRDQLIASGASANSGIITLRISLVIAWVTVVLMTVRAISQNGFWGLTIFFTDFNQGWRAQFNTDFLFHLLLIAGWIFYRHKSPVAGLLGGLAAFLSGSVFTMVYILAVSIRAKGDPRIILLGSNAQ